MNTKPKFKLGDKVDCDGNNWRILAIYKLVRSNHSDKNNKRFKYVYAIETDSYYFPSWHRLSSEIDLRKLKI